MSIFALLVITDEKTVDSACRGWAPPLAEPTKKAMKNPFTGEVLDVVSYIPAEFEGNPDAAGVYDVHDALQNAQPIVIDFKVFGELSTLIGAAIPFRMTRDDEGFLFAVERFPADREDEFLTHFRDQLGQYANAAARRSAGLSTFVYVYDV